MRQTLIAFVAGASAYLLLVASAWIYALEDGGTFAGLGAVMLAWPWIDELPSAVLPIGWLLNAVIAGLASSVVVGGLKFIVEGIKRA